MYKILVENCIGKHGLENRCSICHCKFPPNDFKAALEHIIDPYHKPIADVRAWNNIPETKATQKLLSLSETDYQELFEHNIIYKFKFYYCNYCKSSLSNPQEHIHGKAHQRRYLFQTTNIKIFKVDQKINSKPNTSNQNRGSDRTISLKDHYIKLIEFTNSYICEICECSIPAISNIHDHIKQIKHKNNLAMQKAIVVEEKNSRSNESKENYKPNKSISLKEHHIKLIESTNSFKCEICEYSISEIANIYDHIAGCTHKSNLEKQKKKYSEITNTDDLNFYCKKCNIRFGVDDTLLQCHCLFHLHEEQQNVNMDVIQFKFDDDKTVHLNCLLCEVIMHSVNHLAPHLTGPGHLKKYFVWNQLIRKNERKAFTNSEPRKREYPRELDNYMFDPAEDIKICNKHLDEENQTMLNMDDYDKFYKCFLCNKSFDSVTMLFEHYNNSFIHKHKLSNFYMIYDSPNVADMIEASSSTINEPSSSINDTLNKASTNDNLTKKFNEEQNSSNVKDMVQSQSNNINKQPLSKKNIRSQNNVAKKRVKKERKIRERPNLGPNQMFYNKDILDFGDRYVSMCLESGNENIYKVDYDHAFDLLKLGVSLIFPYKSDRICIPCEYKIPHNFYFLYDHLHHDVHIQNLRDMVEDSKDFEECEDQFSDLDLAKTGMQEESEDCVKCFACDESVPNFDDDIKIHMDSANHISKFQDLKKESDYIIKEFPVIFRDSWYYVERFDCRICNLTFNREISFAKHLQQAEHLEKVKLDKTESNKINICHACSSCWYGKTNFGEHHNEYIHVRNFKRCKTMLPQMSNTAIKFMGGYDKIVKDLIKDSNEITFKHQDKEKQLLESVEETVRSVYPNAKAYAFGSRTSYLGFNTSDVDVFLDCEHKYYCVGSKEKSQKYIRSVQNNFVKVYKDIWKKDKILLHPRVPILKLEHKKTRLKCDISFLSGLGVEKSKLIRSYVVLYKHCRELILYLKKWFGVCDLYGPQAINAYAISWYAIFYLQNKGILPSVYQLIKLKNESKIVDGWQCGFPETIPAVTVINHTFKDILQGFFSFYAEFNYCTDVVCPLLGKVIKKRAFANIDDLPDGMQIYKYRIKTEEIELFRFDSPMCIQDPVDLSQNITKAVSKLQLRCFRSYCAQSFKIMLG